MDDFLKDLKHSFRMFSQSPGFTIAAVAALALGIGANTAIFSVVNTVLLKPLTYPDADHIVQFLLTSPNGSGPGASVPKFALWKEQTKVFEDVAAYDFGGPGLNLTGGAFPEQVKGIHVTADYFHLFGAPIERGRTFSAEEDRPHGPHVVVISDTLWRRRYGADPNLIGKTIELGGEPHTVIGIVGPGFHFDPPSELWLPFQFNLNTNEQAHYFFAAGRLKPGVTLAQANAQLKLTADEFRRKFPGGLMGPRDGFAVQPLRDAIVSDVRSSLLVLVGAVSFVLLIACANVANLLLARATGRKREIAIRAAVGAGRGRIIRQLLTESVLLSVAGGILGLILGVVAVRALLAINPGNIPRIGENGAAVTLDLNVLAFTLGVAVLTGILFGLIPALDASKADLSSTLKESSGRTGSGFRHNKARSLLVVSEMSLAIVLLIGAALLIRTFVALRTVNPGFDPHHVLTMEMSLTGPRFEKAFGVAQMIRTTVDRIEALPGITAAGTTCCMPLEGGFGLPMTIIGRPLSNGGPYHGGGGWTSVSSRYFDVFRIPIVRGRSFNVRDDSGSTPVVIINQAMAHQLWAKSDPLKDRIIIGKGVGPAFDEPPRQIVGVASDIRDGGLNREPRPGLYVPVSQVSDGMTALNARIGPIIWIIRTQGNPYGMRTAVENELRKASGGIPVARVRSMDDVVIHSTARADFNMLLLTVFGCSALFLAAIGIYGLMAYSVEQRTQELGIRIALGAQQGDVRNLVVVQGMRLALVGVLLGTAAAFGLTRLIANLLFGVKTWDPLVFLSVPLILSAVALFAVWLPAHRATRIDPVDALRYE